jgi:hypothetical protein
METVLPDQISQLPGVRPEQGVSCALNHCSQRFGYPKHESLEVVRGHRYIVRCGDHGGWNRKALEPRAAVEVQQTFRGGRHFFAAVRAHDPAQPSGLFGRHSRDSAGAIGLDDYFGEGQRGDDGQKAEGRHAFQIFAQCGHVACSILDSCQVREKRAASVPAMWEIFSRAMRLPPHARLGWRPPRNLAGLSRLVSRYYRFK